VSAHYVICRDGTVVQMVRDDDIAHHAGNLPYNQQSIGLEHQRQANTSQVPTAEQYASSVLLVKWLVDRYAVDGVFPDGIMPVSPSNGNGIIGHILVPGCANPPGGGTNCRTDPVNWDWTIYKTLFSSPGTTTFSVTVTYAALGLPVPNGTNVTWGPYTRQTASGIALFVNVPCETHDLSVRGFWVLDQSFGAYAPCGMTQTAVECERGDCTTESTAVAEADQLPASAGFVIGDRVEVYNTGGIGLRAWNDICSNGYVVKQEGARGLVLDGPRCCNGYDRWQIRWDGESVARWSAEGDQATGEYWLRNVSVPVVSAPTITPNGGSFTGPVQINLSTVTSGATITFTTTGADPTMNSASYGAPFLLNASATIKARAFKNGYSDSSISAAAFIISPPSNQILYVSTTSIDVASGAGSASIFVHNDGSGSMTWSASENCPWISNVTAGGTSVSPWDDNRLDFSYDANTSTGTRACAIDVSAPGASGSPKTVTVTQAGTCGGTGIKDLVPLEGYLVDAGTGDRLSTIVEGQEISAAVSYRFDIQSNYCTSWIELHHLALRDGVFWNDIVQPEDEVCAGSTTPGSNTTTLRKLKKPQAASR